MISYRDRDGDTAVYAFPYASVAVGTFWAAWTAHGFWWALLYGFFAPVWLAFRLATWLLS